MGQPLFQLSDDFVTSLCFGSNDRDVEQRFVEAFEAGRVKLRDEVRQRTSVTEPWREASDDIDVVLGTEGYVIALPEDVEDELLDLEYGTADQPMQPLLRQSVSQSRIDVEKAIANVLEFD